MSKIGELNPNTITTLDILAELCLKQGHLAEAEPLLVQSLERSRRAFGDHHLKTIRRWYDLARCHVDAGQFAKAASDLADAEAANPGDSWIWYRRGCVLACLPDEAAYRAHCDAMVKQMGQTQDAGAADRLVKTALLLPENGGRRASAAVLKQLGPAIQVLESNQTGPWQQLNLGVVKYRLGLYTEAAELLSKSRDDIGEAPGAATCGLYLAIALQAAGGRDAAAKEALQQALALIDKEMPKAGEDLGAGFFNWLVCQVALREAQHSWDCPMPDTRFVPSPAAVPATGPIAGSRLREPQDAPHAQNGCP
jgi:tetratricopeptide (TPR) repeat protein